MGSCINDSQWKIGAFLTNSYANPKKFRSRKKKINFGLNQQPDCVVILKADRKSSVILEADRSQIPIIALVDSTIPWESYKRITYPIPANDPIQFVYLFRHSITKTADRPRINPRVDRPRTGARAGTLRGSRSYSSASGEDDTPDPDSPPVPVEVDSPDPDSPPVPVEVDSPQSRGGEQANFIQIEKRGGTPMEVESPPLQDQKGAGKVGTSEGPPEAESRKRKFIESDGDSDSGEGPPGKKPRDAGYEGDSESGRESDSNSWGDFDF